MTTEEVLDRLAALGEITSRPMFGGVGLYWRGVIFGIVFPDRLYLKVDDRSRDDYLARGMGSFHPNERQTLKSYFEVPPEVLADAEALLSWAGEAIRAAQESQGPVA
jgi:DNA transformation protein and related proteins